MGNNTLTIELVGGPRCGEIRSIPFGALLPIELPDEVPPTSKEAQPVSYCPRPVVVRYVPTPSVTPAFARNTLAGHVCYHFDGWVTRDASPTSA